VVRVAAQREPEPAVVESGAGKPAPSEPRARARRARGAQSPPQIVDHAEERAARGAGQGSFAFREQRPHGPYRLPDVAMFQDPPAAPAPTTETACT